MFIRLGIVNIVRQLSRSTLALVSMVLAAISLTNNLALSTGYPSQAYANYRDYLGGDIIFYPTRIMSSPTDTGAKLQQFRLAPNEFSTLTLFYPHLTTEGFLSPTTPTYRPLIENDLEKAQAHSQVRELTPIYRMPGRKGPLHGDTQPVALRSMPANGDLEKYLVDFNTTNSDNDGQITVWLNKHQTNTKWLPSIGETILVSLPSFRRALDGSLQTIDTVGHSFEAVVGGYYELPTRVLGWVSDQGTALSEQGYFHVDEVWLTEADWLQLWAQAADNLTPAAFSYGARVRDLGILEATASELQVAHPNLTVVSSPNLAKVSEQGALIDGFRFAPKEIWSASPKPQLGVPVDMGRTLALFVYLNAGLLMGARMLTGASARRKEIGVLKALGARRRDVLLMSLTEAVVLAVIGATVGFFIAYIAAFFQQLTNQIPFGQMLALLAKNYFTVLLQTFAVAVVFGLMPALRLSKLTVSEVLRA